MRQPLVSIVMPAYNAEKYIAASVQSILSQTYTNFELLIADDCSTDQTKSILSNFSDSRISFHHNESNQGYLKTCNKLFLLCKGELVTFQDADDSSVTDRIEKQVNEFLKDKDLSVCTSNSVMIDSAGKKIMSRKWAIDYEKFRSDADYEALLCGATIMLKNTLLKEIGLYHEYFNRLGGEDYEWFFRAACKGKGMHLNDELYLYRIHNSAVKVNNTASRTIYIHEIIHEIRRQFILNKKYLLDGKHDDELKMLEEKFEKEFKNEPSKAFRIKANGAIAIKQYANFLKLSWAAFKTEPFNSKNYSAFFTSIYNRFKGIIYNLVKPNS
jgi:glycosyltransferase involved in cell wall biosynthesis